MNRKNAKNMPVECPYMPPYYTDSHVGNNC